jgi:hypothetical protein
LLSHRIYFAADTATSLKSGKRIDPYVDFLLLGLDAQVRVADLHDDLISLERIKDSLMQLK